MNIYLDDIRNPNSEGWTIVRDAYSAIDIILSNWNNIDNISLDHDLGDESIVGNGYKVVLAIENYVYKNHPAHLPKIYVHSANPVASKRMCSAINHINKIYQELSH